jgi:hypothetical protein
MAVEIDEEELTRELRGLLTRFFSSPEGATTCSLWWELHSRLAREGDETSRFRVIGAIGALGAWISRSFSTEDAVAMIEDEDYAEAREFMPTLLDMARREPNEENSSELSDVIWEYIESQEGENPRLLFGALVTLMRPAFESERDDKEMMAKIACQEVLAAKDDTDALRRIWDALASGDGELSLQLRVLILIAQQAVSTSGHAPYPGLGVDAISFVAYQIATCIAHGNEDLASHVGAAFLMMCDPQESHQLAAFLAAHVR